MPRMMSTVLNVGLTAEATAGVAVAPEWRSAVTQVPVHRSRSARVLFGRQGDDVVSGRSLTRPLRELAGREPTVWDDFLDALHRVEDHYGDACYLEFTFEAGELWVLQVRPGRLIGAAAVRVAVDLVRRGRSPRWPRTRSARWRSGVAAPSAGGGVLKSGCRFHSACAAMTPGDMPTGWIVEGCARPTSMIGTSVRATDASVQWPPLPLEEWRATKETLHRYCQMIGKVRLALHPFRNHWWHVTLRLATRGLTTGAMPVGDGRLAEIRLDLADHALEVRDSSGDAVRFSLRDPLPCADFHAALFDALGTLRISADIDARPYDLDGPAFPDDHIHDAYDAEAVSRFWQTIASSAVVLEGFAGWFNGKHSPVHLFWHSFDLAHARFSGRRAPVREGAGVVEAEAYSHEVIAFGFWSGDDNVPYPAYYSYTAPAPDGLTDQPLQPAEAQWDPSSGTAVVPYDVVRQSESPRGTLLAFLQSAYLAGARTAGWDIDDLRTRAAPESRT